MPRKWTHKNSISFGPVTAPTHPLRFHPHILGFASISHRNSRTRTSACFRSFLCSSSRRRVSWSRSSFSSPSSSPTADTAKSEFQKFTQRQKNDRRVLQKKGFFGHNVGQKVCFLFVEKGVKKLHNAWTQKNELCTSMGSPKFILTVNRLGPIWPQKFAPKCHDLSHKCVFQKKKKKNRRRQRPMVRSSQDQFLKNNKVVHEWSKLRRVAS